MGIACITYGGEVYRGLWRGNLRERDHFEDPDIDGRIILRWIIRKWKGVWSGLMWLKLRTGVGYL
jgi:hypothetical protein